MDFENKISSVLFEIGLTEIQSNVYFNILKSGGSTVTKIAKSLKINRTNSYIIIDKLKSLNLVWEDNLPKGKIIYAKSYDVILKNLNRKKELLSDFEKDVNGLIPVFNSYVNQKSKLYPRVRIYEGVEGLNEITYDIIDSNFNLSEILLFSNQEDEQKLFNAANHDDFIKRRIKNKINIRVLATNNRKGVELQSLDKKYLRETKLLPKSFNFNSEVYIYNDKLAMIDLKENNIVGVIIESQELSNIQKQLFEFLWNNKLK